MRYAQISQPSQEFRNAFELRNESKIRCASIFRRALSWTSRKVGSTHVARKGCYQHDEQTGPLLGCAKVDR